MKNGKKDYIGWMIFIGSVILLLEIFFFSRGLIFSLTISLGMIYLGNKKKEKKKGKVLFWGGIFFFCASIFNMLTFKLLLLAVLLHFFIQYVNSKRHPKMISPILTEPKIPFDKETVIQSQPLLENVLFGRQSTPAGTYEWNDINIQAGVGDTVIDFSYTVFPNEEAVIFIRNIIGNVRILVPYDIEVSIHHSVIVGSTAIFDFHELRMFNKVLHIKTLGYEKAEQKIKIFTSLIVGNLEVDRI